MLASMENRVRRWLYGRDLAVWYAPEYRWPLSALEARTGFQTRRAAFALWYLLERRALGRRNLRRRRRAEYQELARVHTPELLDSLGRPDTLARVFSVDPSDVPVDEVMSSVRLVCGATIAAAREMLSGAGPREVGRRALNLLGGFHHATPDVPGGFCPVNDVAIAIAAVRAEGFRGRVLVLDLDAHPPDGTAACLARDPSYWIGSISGSDWGAIPNADETVLPERAGDAEYLAALDALLERMPHGELAFVLAGGDVLAGDPVGQLGLSLEGCRERDLRVADALVRVPSVWLPAGGYTLDAWKVLAGTGLALALRSRSRIARDYDPLVARFSAISRTLAPQDLGEATTEMDGVAEQLGIATPRRRLLLGFYSAEGLEHALERYGILGELRRMGYGPFRVEVQDEGVGQSARLLDVPGGQALIETVFERREVAGAQMLYVHWLALRNPRARFSDERPQLPGQDVPGLGLAREMAELLSRMAARLGLEGVAFRPSPYHLAFRGREVMRFVDPARQGRFEALVDLLKDVPLVDATRAVAEGRIRLNGAPYSWETDEMVRWLEPRPDDRAAIDQAKEASHFTIAGV
ncbi:MAG: histone deacetylase [Deltaproteobacteria bacterium 13_1_20CM_2_69_21]|nr:MAG: histone deacetylase [Deltaproteobacteria bacterium 13_1_40CM_4_68_19]OLD10138.1 MAG: histone deacetylase [Deltaproteobacteria bacterium 13_1_40CM_3_69_14]OLD45503.1 MAG: histone deacetylase [Chloroflexi bacterium 13_1_40CM_2_68_14]OLE62781.1 MAG: histone deacetylase [Deltaproteobacteria bacterium 13_1_20CM_2_69_21]